MEIRPRSHLSSSYSGRSQFALLLAGRTIVGTKFRRVAHAFKPLYAHNAVSFLRAVSTVIVEWSKSPLRTLGVTVMWFILALVTLWAATALYVDFRVAAWRFPVALIYVLGIIVILLIAKPYLEAAALCFAGFCIVLTWWLNLRPSNDGDWQANVSRTASVDINGDRVTIHNLRNCDYRTETDYTNDWSDRTVYLSQLRSLDFFFTNWGPKWIGHPILSFQFGDNDHIAFSIEVRYKVGQSYSEILGFFRQYELIFVVADERDVIRLRTNYRKGEQVFMYRTTTSPMRARGVFVTYADYLNKLRDHPEWYNALTRNCTTTLDRQIAANLENPRPRTYRHILNGKLDELLYDCGRLVTAGLPFPELRQREHINAAARAANQSPDFSAQIRVGRIGF
jgi:Domain of unknown function (DUF4105)